MYLYNFEMFLKTVVMLYSIYIYIHSVKKVPGIDHSKSALSEIVKNLLTLS